MPNHGTSARHIAAVSRKWVRINLNFILVQCREQFPPYRSWVSYRCSQAGTVFSFVSNDRINHRSAKQKKIHIGRMMRVLNVVFGVFFNLWQYLFELYGMLRHQRYALILRKYYYVLVGLYRLFLFRSTATTTGVTGRPVAYRTHNSYIFLCALAWRQNLNGCYLPYKQCSNFCGEKECAGGRSSPIYFFFFWYGGRDGGNYGRNNLSSNIVLNCC